jgi:hypothetical protein
MDQLRRDGPTQWAAERANNNNNNNNTQNQNIARDTRASDRQFLKDYQAPTTLQRETGNDRKYWDIRAKRGGGLSKRGKTRGRRRGTTRGRRRGTTRGRRRGTHRM